MVWDGRRRERRSERGEIERGLDVLLTGDLVCKCSLPTHRPAHHGDSQRQLPVCKPYMISGGLVHESSPLFSRHNPEARCPRWPTPAQGSPVTAHPAGPQLGDATSNTACPASGELGSSRRRLQLGPSPLSAQIIPSLSRPWKQKISRIVLPLWHPNIAGEEHKALAPALRTQILSR
ncbi:uncharacterized protein K452DRAFT_115875 [Aplosporella prunicola CBS 121167]|uniref:Uncharacterized protein n=1 Tax=Aplosporella prunicola CBS 121167 TaxID=1176127 RepID=A0A6A6AZ98_9PEZI|nr:uncharacterized protein K452DRAFT_115875 [Aplosporella prunicola CBS 121167]KAF2136966.1 hypothetical protein K452DRAFT_115875 [Aplosporella prunicola CBS 121167]